MDYKGIILIFRPHVPACKIITLAVYDKNCFSPMSKLGSLPINPRDRLCRMWSNSPPGVKILKTR